MLLKETLCFKRRLGVGAFGKVYLEQESKFVVKIVSFQGNDLDDLVLNEIQTQRRLHHSNIIKLFGQFVDSEATYLVLEFASEGDLQTKLAIEGPFNCSQTALYVKEMASALEHCHENGVIHRYACHIVLKLS
jgi:serine/threonine protein kinase